MSELSSLVYNNITRSAMYHVTCPSLLISVLPGTVKEVQDDIADHIREEVGREVELRELP